MNIITTKKIIASLIIAIMLIGTATPIFAATTRNKTTSSSTKSILASLFKITIKGAETGAKLTFEILSGLLGKLDGGLSTVTPGDTNNDKLNLNKSNISMTVSETATITATVNNKTVRPTYTSSNTDVATVGKYDGKITAKKGGTAIITATYDGKTATCEVSVAETTAVSTKSFYQIAGNCMSTLVNKGFSYSKNRSQYTFANATPATTNTKTINCSQYVSWVIYEYAKQKNISELKEDFKISMNTTSLYNYMKNSNYFEYKGILANINTSNLKAGDILLRTSGTTHSEIFSNYNTSKSNRYRCYTAGSNDCLNGTYPQPCGGGCNGNTSSYYVFRIK